MQTAIFYASGKRIRFMKENDIQVTNMPNNHLDLKTAAAKVAAGEVDLLVLDDYSVNRALEIYSAPLWQDPRQATAFGLSLAARDPGGHFQIYVAKTPAGQPVDCRIDSLPSGEPS